MNAAPGSQNPAEQQRPLVIPQGHVFRVKTQNHGVKAFRIDKKLGEGGVGIVYRAYEDSSGEPAVVKTPKFWGLKDISSKIEERILLGLDHPNIMKMFGSIVDRYGHHIQFYEYLFPNPLLYMNSAEVRDKITVKKGRDARYIPLPPSVGADVCAELLRGLERFHADGLVHHDVKLGNFMIRFNTDVARLSTSDYFDLLLKKKYRGVIIDAGGVRNLEYHDRLNRGEKTVVPPQLTPVLSPPEVLEAYRLSDGQSRQFFSASIDVYQAAIVIYAILTGHTPYSHVPKAGSLSNLENLMNLKRAEHRGEIAPFSIEVLKRVRFRGDCPFVARGEHVRARYDQNLFNLLHQRVSPDPAARGTMESFRRDFEALFDMKPVRYESSGDTLRRKKKFKERHLSKTQSIFHLNDSNRLSEAAGRKSQAKHTIFMNGSGVRSKFTGRITRGFYDQG